MEINANFVNCLSADVTSLVMQQLNDPADVVRAAAVSTAWRHFIIANGIFKKMWKRKVPHVSIISYGTGDSDELTILSDIASSNAVDWGTLEKEHNIFCTLLRPLSKNSIRFSADILGYPIGASSTHNDRIMSIVHTLIPIDTDSCGSTAFWCSKGATDPDVPEHLLYKLRYELCVVNQFDLRPFEAILEPGNLVYAAISVRFRMGYPKHPKDAGILYHGNDPDHYVWAYTSPVYPVRQEPRLQELKLPEPVVCLGGVIMVEPGSEKRRRIVLHMCGGCVRVVGWSLGPAYMLEMLNSGVLHLNYCPRTIDSIFRRITARYSQRFPLPQPQDHNRRTRRSCTCI